MKISKKRLIEIIEEECAMANEPMTSYNMDGIDKEGGMAKRQLHDMEKYAHELSEMLSDTTQLESWVQAKLTKAADYLKTVKHYVEYGMEEGAYDQVMPEMEPESVDMGYYDNEIGPMDIDDEEMMKIVSE
jgi:hypothetical protein|tara:strand:- start:879 stop:1271 length:393 start_codon:yes stop_codon:yes gene_type:complete